ncbi:hypothetical protein DCO58_06005 [Helicobacter saguini]|uniref:Outer membrane protein beta-barrel domain-containing protein n=1 Tax=Helicobacter saguini TaxID=1548018 RepID=A0A347VTG7_9HELI|nr:hypothetical protein [Helicobacter saguini]MWV62106.1 hypothetical protein [Helicobacter saguini]MWV67222.1 hypothetical protein [Helicobacter saguini]MWV69574.1 hypothetical protein [Helicobacter saguini]MWV70875.1 hypothetical protein [Helicobacter saguini]TLD94293.1 hypothetical protein LS64_006125 [Helicobacter saguini]
MKKIILLCLINMCYAAIPTTNKEFSDNNMPQDSKTIKHNVMLGATFGIGIAFDILQASGVWDVKETSYPYRNANIKTNVNMGSVSIFGSYQYIGHTLHFLSDTRLGFGANVLTSDYDYSLYLEQLTGYYFPFGNNVGLAFKIGLILNILVPEKYSEVNDTSIYPYMPLNTDITAIYFFGSKIGLEYNFSNITLGGFFTYLFYYDISIASSVDTTSLNMYNAINKSFPYGWQVEIVYRF